MSKWININGYDAVDIFLAFCHEKGNQHMTFTDARKIFIHKRFSHPSYNSSKFLDALSFDKTVNISGAWIGDEFYPQLCCVDNEFIGGECNGELIVSKYKQTHPRKLFDQREDCREFLKLYRQDFHRTSNFFGMFSSCRLLTLIKQHRVTTMADVIDFAAQCPDSRAAKFLQSSFLQSAEKKKKYEECLAAAKSFHFSRKERESIERKEESAAPPPSIQDTKYPF